MPGARRVLFINPGIGRGWGTDFTYKELLPSVGIEYVAGAARAAGHQVAIVDMRADDLTIRDAVARAAAFEPDVLALSAYSKQMAVVGELLSAAKQALPRCTTVLGGPHASAIPLDTLGEFPDLDVAVFGEGETTIVE